MMNLVFVIQKTEGNQTVTDFLLLEEALQQWKVQGYEHPEYKIVMRPSRVFYISPEDLEQNNDINQENDCHFVIENIFYIENYGPYN